MYRLYMYLYTDTHMHRHAHMYTHTPACTELPHKQDHCSVDATPLSADWELGTVSSESPIKGQAVNFVEIRWVPRKARGSCLSQFALNISFGPPSSC